MSGDVGSFSGALPGSVVAHESNHESVHTEAPSSNRRIATRPRGPLSPVEIAQLVSAYRQTSNVHKAAREVGRSSGTAYRALKSAGILLPRRGSPRGARQRGRHITGPVHGKGVLRAAALHLLGGEQSLPEIASQLGVRPSHHWARLVLHECDRISRECADLAHQDCAGMRRARRFGPDADTADKRQGVAGQARRLGAAQVALARRQALADEPLPEPGSAGDRWLAEHDGARGDRSLGPT